MAPLRELGIEAPAFLEKLWDMLDDESNWGVIEWDEGGMMFEVKSPKNMASFVLNKYFRHNNFASFQRQLNYFGFHKCGKGEHGCYYAHQSFVRSNPRAMLGIQRKTNHSNARAGGAGGASRPSLNVAGLAGLPGLPGHAMGVGAPGAAGIGAQGMHAGVKRPFFGGAAAPGMAGMAVPGMPGGGLIAAPPAPGVGKDSPLGLLASAGAADLAKRQRTGLYVNDPGLVAITPLTPGAGVTPGGRPRGGDPWGQIPSAGAPAQPQPSGSGGGGGGGSSSSVCGCSRTRLLFARCYPGSVRRR